ncbi:MAG TPA: ATP-binding protein [Clostridia bacterium]|nr:ATP-binding protein [Clostridia bacterium]
MPKRKLQLRNLWSLALKQIRSLQLRLVAMFVAIAFSLVVPIGIILNIRVESSYYNFFKRDIENGFSTWKTGNNPTAKKIKDLYDEKNAAFFFKTNGSNKSYTIYGISTAKIYYSSDSKLNAPDGGLKILKSRNFLSAMSNGQNSKKLVHEDGRAFFDYALKVGNYILYFRYYSDDWQDIINNFNSIIKNSILIAIIISLILGYMLSKTIIIPIVNIMHKAERLAEGNFDEALEVKSEDEIGNLTKTFNFMAKELKSNLNEISSEKNKIETILNYMADGVIAFDLEGQVIHANPASKNMLGVDDFKDDFKEFSEKYDLGVRIEDFLYLGIINGREAKIQVDDKFLKVYFALFTDEEKKAEGIIAVLQDITEMQKLELMRREFVANVSHELRTPLTSIKSYSETLLDGALEDRGTAERFLGVISSEADRMTRIVKDLLQLSRLDNQQMQMKMILFNIEELIKNTVRNIQIEAENKRQVIECFTIGDIPEINADRDRIEQVVVNILSNAIKYTPEMGNITVYIGRIYNDVYFKVVDNGIGIPQKDLPRIFERFYRVDKARSREMGGTGLGLSIAKEIVEAHGGSITITSDKDKGTEVVVKLPVEHIDKGDGVKA